MDFNAATAEDGLNLVEQAYRTSLVKQAQGNGVMLPRISAAKRQQIMESLRKAAPWLGAGAAAGGGLGLLGALREDDEEERRPVSRALLGALMGAGAGGGLGLLAKNVPALGAATESRDPPPSPGIPSRFIDALGGRGADPNKSLPSELASIALRNPAAAAAGVAAAGARSLAARPRYGVGARIPGLAPLSRAVHGFRRSTPLMQASNFKGVLDASQAKVVSELSRQLHAAGLSPSRIEQLMARHGTDVTRHFHETVAPQRAQRVLDVLRRARRGGSRGVAPRQTPQYERANQALQRARSIANISPQARVTGGDVTRALRRSRGPWSRGLRGGATTAGAGAAGFLGALPVIEALRNARLPDMPDVSDVPPVPTGVRPGM